MTQTHSLIACHDCDLLQKNPPLAQFSPRCSRIPFNTRCFWTGTGAQFSPRSIQFNTPLRSTGGHSAPSSRWTAAVVVECPRCGAILRRTQKNSLDRTIAWIIAGLILYFVAVYFPFLAMQSHGISNETALISGIIVLYEQGMGGMALVVLATCLILPLFAMLTLLYILVPLRMNRRLPGAASLFAWNQRLRPWGMMEVYMLGILVSMVKLTKLARIIPGPALYAFIALIFVLAASSVSLDNHLIWDFFQSPPEGGKSDKRP